MDSLNEKRDRHWIIKERSAEHSHTGCRRMRGDVVGRDWHGARDRSRCVIQKDRNRGSLATDLVGGDCEHSKKRRELGRHGGESA